MKIFTPKEATQTLPLVRKIVEDILNTGQKIKRMLNEDISPESPELNELRISLQNYIEELEEIGCYFKDFNFEYGLVDFPSEFNGVRVLLCWRSDEPMLKYYHDYVSGFMGRKLIPEEYLS